MCGIVGFVGEKGVSEDWLQAALQFLSFRGPDFAGSLTQPGYSFGATRLSMVDPNPRSNQPFQIGNKILLFNGEIYNYSQLKHRMLYNYTFLTESDTEVLLRMIEVYGDSAIDDLNGMFAFVIFDTERKELLACRDRLGKKPLYFREDSEGGQFVFSSLQNPLRSIGENHLDGKALITYLHLGFIVDSLTMYKEIKSLKPYESMKLGKGNFSLQEPRKYVRKYMNQTSKSLRSLVVDSVMQRVGDHKRVALSLSGGIDSTVIGLVLAENNVEVNAYSVYWSDSDKSRYNEDFNQAKRTAENLGFGFRAIDAPKSLSVPDMLMEYLSIMEEPNNNPTGLSMIPLYKSIATDGIRLALTGDGADEIFGGYARYKRLTFLNPLAQVLRWGCLPGFLKSKESERLERFGLDNWEDWARWHEVYSRKELTNKLHLDSTTANDVFGDLEDEFNRISSRIKSGSLKKMMLLDQSIWLAMESNRRLDRVSMAFSVEARSPFQDDRFYEWWYGRSNSRMILGLGKGELLKAFPEIVELRIQKKKSGFISPLGHWIRSNLGWVKHSWDRLSNEGIVPPKTSSEIYEIAHSGDLRKLRQLWTLVVLSCWLKSQDSVIGVPKNGI